MDNNTTLTDAEGVPFSQLAFRPTGTILLRQRNITMAGLTPDTSDDLGLQISLSILSVFIVLANLTVCVLVFLKKSMRTYTNGFVVSLAFSDMLIGSVLIPAVLDLPNSPVQGYLISTTLLSGVFNLAAVTFDRYVSVLKALHYEEIMRKYFTKLIAVSWLAAVSISLIPLVWGTDTSTLAHKVYVFSVMAFCVVAPYALIFWGYCKIFQQVKKSIKRERELIASVRKMTQRKNKLTSEVKLAQVFIIVAVMFVLSWLPIHYMTTVDEIGRSDLIPNDLRIVSLYTIALGSLVNPTVYSFLKPDFRKAIRRTFHKGKRFATWNESQKMSATSSYRSRVVVTFTTNAADRGTTRV